MDFCNKLEFVPGKPFQSSLMFVVKARKVPQSGAPERCFTWVSSSLTSKGKGKCYSLLQKSVIYDRKNFYRISPRPLHPNFIVRFYVILKIFENGCNVCVFSKIIICNKLDFYILIYYSQS